MSVFLLCPWLFQRLFEISCACGIPNRMFFVFASCSPSSGGFVSAGGAPHAYQRIYHFRQQKASVLSAVRLLLGALPASPNSAITCVEQLVRPRWSRVLLCMCNSSRAGIFFSLRWQHLVWLVSNGRYIYNAVGSLILESLLWALFIVRVLVTDIYRDTCRASHEQLVSVLWQLPFVPILFTVTCYVYLQFLYLVCVNW